MTTTYNSIKSLREALKPLRANKTIALVPTMGNLHQGHISLVKLAKQHADIVVVSIFVNPTQFGAGEDLDSYPRTLEADTDKLKAAEADYIFAPTVDEMYPVMPPPTQVLAGNISKILCGKSRPTHFDGVGIVVTKLFNIIQPDVAVFGKKDYQQLAIIKQLVRDLSFDIQLVGGPIVRAEDGLALSSRNQYLTQQERAKAPELHKAVQDLALKLQDGKATCETDLKRLIEQSIAEINAKGFKVDYLEVKNQDLTPITEFAGKQSWLIAVAAWLGKARLLDNQEVDI
ncbi:pantoate--beta-alanine ligase [Psychrobacter phenylpyruvicus]|uniref:Pantothenate synthetase n=1 Tax=Psychrobacter phenylpyruvicus TaxID=29432 RepID=A0A379LI98_9GAMM|nr:pantoate--beta-alanine ligase [Psychrobacter phenylpyruvicus]SUD89815.1 Pantothenate synthetase [Psychrobacter phenylpyruvicus]